MAQINQIKLPLDAVASLLVRKLQVYAELFDLMDQHGGWFPYPESVLSYFDELGVVHWAELYFPEGIAKLVKNKEPQLKQFAQLFSEDIGKNPSIEAVQEMLIGLAQECAQESTVLPGLEFLDTVPNPDLVKSLTDQERHYQREVLLGFLVGFYNDLSIAAHGESIIALAIRARDHHDEEALVKAVQIDPTILKYFEKVLMNKSMSGNVDFFDSLAYRIKNSPRKGRNEHPLLWILMKDLLSIRCLRPDVTSENILNVYQDGVGNHPKYVIDDVQIVQRQRRKFNKLYRQVK